MPRLEDPFLKGKCHLLRYSFGRYSICHSNTDWNYWLFLCRFDVQGIPALVVLDTVSGNIIVSKEVSKSQVNQACQGGDDAIETMYSMWVDQIPEDSKVRLQHFIDISLSPTRLNSS